VISSEVRRTLVKSPPELWAELSDPPSLARHLEAFEEVRITRVVPESRIEWEAREATGAIAMQPSGWGTQVVLSVLREPEPQAASSEPEPSAPAPAPATAPAAEEPPAAEGSPPTEKQPAADTEPAAQSGHAEAAAEAAAGEGGAAAEQPPAAQHTPAAERRRGFFSRLFARMRARRAAAAQGSSVAASQVHPPTTVEDRRRSHAAQSEASDGPNQARAVEKATGPDEPPVAPEPPPADGARADGATDLTGELAALERQLTEETTALLVSMLDRLGSAHHRPFSRA